MYRLYIFLVVFFWTCTHLLAQDTLTVSSALEIGLKNNYSIIISKNSEQISRNNNTIGNAGFLPDVTANYNNTRGINDSRAELANGTVREGSGVQSKNINGNALVTWTVFDGFNMFINKNKLHGDERICLEDLQFLYSG